MNSETFILNVYAPLRARLESPANLSLVPVRRKYRIQGEKGMRDHIHVDFHIPGGPRNLPPSNEDHLRLAGYQKRMDRAWRTARPRQLTKGVDIVHVFIDSMRGVSHGMGQVNWSAIARAMGYKSSSKNTRPAVKAWWDFLTELNELI